MSVLIYFLLHELPSWAIEWVFIDEAVKMVALYENSPSLDWWWLSLLEEEWPVTRARSDPVNAEIARNRWREIRQYSVCWASKYGFPTINIQFSQRCVGLVNLQCMGSLFPVLANAKMLIWLNSLVLHQLRSSCFVNVGVLMASCSPARWWQ